MGRKLMFFLDFCWFYRLGALGCCLTDSEPPTPAYQEGVADEVGRSQRPRVGAQFSLKGSQQQSRRQGDRALPVGLVGVCEHLLAA